MDNYELRVRSEEGASLRAGDILTKDASGSEVHAEN